jgi:hypothetical protein
VDHIYHNTADNRPESLRWFSRSNNCANRKIKGKGYCWDTKSKKWRAYIKIDNEQMSLGFFDLEEDAKIARAEVFKRLFPEIHC